MRGDESPRALQAGSAERAIPKTLFCDNGAEFTSQAMGL
jgi:putative transposase